jgi:hypothetical protein
MKVTEKNIDKIIKNIKKKLSEAKTQCYVCGKYYKEKSIGLVSKNGVFYHICLKCIEKL